MLSEAKHRKPAKIWQSLLLKNAIVVRNFAHCTDKKENQILLIYKEIKNRAVAQWWANLDQAPKDLDKTIFRDLSPTPIP